jgi:UDP-glucose 4-epimerase
MIATSRGRQVAVVTGGAGFIGSHLVERLLGEGFAVRVIDSLVTGRLANLEHLASAPGLEVVEADVADHERIRPVLEGADRVFHLAALADIVPSIQRPLEYHRCNVDGTVSVLEAARLAGVGRLVYTASSSCYGLADQVPTPETAPIRPMYPYAMTKYVGEQMALHWCRVYHLPCVSLRLFNVYGPRSRTTGAYGAVFGVFLAQKLAGRPFTVVGDGTQTRDFTYVTDIVEAFLLASETPDPDGASSARGNGRGDRKIVGEVFNVGSGGTYSINQLVGLLGGDVVYVPRRPGEPDCTLADVGKIERCLGFRARIGFAEGVVRMLEQIELWRDAPVWDQGSIQEATRDWFRYLGPEHEQGEPGQPADDQGR